MARTIAVEVVTPERRVYAGQVEMLIARGSEGELGVLPGHAPLITALRDGVLRLRQPGGGELHIATSGGFLEVRADGVVVLADEAHLPGDVGLREPEPEA
jgi:F-type H+-transporting ATPase subunit epsilon